MDALDLHKMHKGKIEINTKVLLENKDDLSLVYTPGVGNVSLDIFKDKKKIYEYTSKWNSVAIVTDGSAVLGLGNIGPEAALPVMEGKSILFKKFGRVDAFPICLSTNDVVKIVEIVKSISTTFGGINLEDISAPRCFEIEERLKKETDIPVFHDDQHGTAIVVLAALINALKVVGKKFNEVKIVISGAGAAGIAIAKLLLSYDVENLILCDTKGILYEGRNNGVNPYKEEIAKVTNRERMSGTLADALRESDILIGVSAPNIVTKEMVSSMNEDAIVFAMSNPIPEIMPDKARNGGARIIATGRSDFSNQINNMLAFPGVFRGALDCRAKAINEEMKITAAESIANLVEEPTPEKIVPDPFDFRVPARVAEAVVKVAVETGMARKDVDIKDYYKKTLQFIQS